ncbi:uncharacterized protein [Dysidea avara]|uniref:uncharacterized protein isoform X2 n=1 Tax=Dysidea avara TaxID=196820 RepID=UPI00331C6612
MAAQSGIKLVTVWVLYDYDSAVSENVFENVKAEILDKCSNPEVVPGTLTVRAENTELPEGPEPFEVSVSYELVWSKIRTGRYPTSASDMKITDAVKAAYRR